MLDVITHLSALRGSASADFYRRPRRFSHSFTDRPSLFPRFLISRFSGVLDLVLRPKRDSLRNSEPTWEIAIILRSSCGNQCVATSPLVRARRYRGTKSARYLPQNSVPRWGRPLRMIQCRGERSGILYRLARRRRNFRRLLFGRRCTER